MVVNMKEEKRKYWSIFETICNLLWISILLVFIYGLITNTHPLRHFFLFGGIELIYFLAVPVLITFASYAGIQKRKYY